MLKQKYKKLQQALHHEFSDAELLKTALTHRSAAKNHNERLEFLGDSVLGMVIAEALYIKFPAQPEGKLTRMRASLVNRDTLANIARELDLGDLIKLGSGEMKSGGHRRDSILSDTVEAILGAVYLDAGFEVARNSINTLFEQRLKKLDPSIQIKDSKTRLQEFLQSRRLALPEYEVVNISGKDHAQTFEVRCSVNSLALESTASGRSRRLAEQKAAQAVLEKIAQ